MTVTSGSGPAQAGGSSEHSLRVDQVTGGADTSVIGMSDITSAALRSALQDSLRNLGYLAADDAMARYVVSADLVELDRPVVALDPVVLFVPVDLSVTVRIHYMVRPSSGGAPIFDEVVATTGTATSNDALTPAGRVRKANEAGVRLNFAEFLKRTGPKLH